MRKFLNSKNICLFKRTLSIRRPILAYSLSSIVDILIISLISRIFEEITTQNINFNLTIGFVKCIVLIFSRTILVYLLRSYSINQLLTKKHNDENKIMNKFVKDRISNNFNDDFSINRFKENLVNSSNLATINFDIPVVSILSELIFALGGIFILIKIFGIRIFIYNFPAFLLLIIFSKFIAKRLNNIGKKTISFTEERLRIIDNISELSFEISALKSFKKLSAYLTKVNLPYNNLIGKQIITSNMMQLTTESTAFLIILVSLICLILSIAETSISNSAASLVVLSRMVPSITRSIAFFAQLQFGIPSVLNLSKKEFDT